MSIYINPKGNCYFLDNRKPLSKASQDPLSFVMVSPEIIKINFWSHLTPSTAMKFRPKFF